MIADVTNQAHDDDDDDDDDDDNDDDYGCRVRSLQTPPHSLLPL